MREELSLHQVMAHYRSAQPEMSSILEPLLALLVIVAPLGLAYVILSLQARKSAGGHRKAPAILHSAQQQKRTELFRSEEERATR